MKKIVSTIAALALIFAMAVPVSAASSPSGGSGQDVVPSASSDSTQAAIVISAPSINGTQSSTLAAAAAAAAGENAYTVETIDVELKDANGNIITHSYFDNNSSITIDFARNDASEVLAVLYWNEATQSWDSASFSQNGTTVSATFSHLCLISFVVKESAATAAPADSDASTSAQTGYTAIIWVAAAAVCVVGAGICFKASKKKSAGSAD